MTDVQQKRDALELAVLLKTDKHPEAREAFIRAFEYMLAEYVREMLTEEDDGKALHARAKALGLIDTLNQMGVNIAQVMEKTPVKRAIGERVRESLNTY